MSPAPAYTWRDAGLHSRALRALDVLGRGLAAVGLERPALRPHGLLRAARRATGLDDFGAGGHVEALDVLCASIERDARASTFGRIALRGLTVGALANRLRLVDWAKRHPEVRKERIERPWVIVGLPRTGTTLLSLLLGLDPNVRPLLQWEASNPIPPPDLASHLEDPRIAAEAKQLGQLAALNPPMRAMHPMGATLATECVTLFLYDLRSMAIETQAFLPGYGRWLENADMSSAYAIHRLALQTLQSRLPTEAWSLKSPHHLWCLDALCDAYPDARILWTHRDPMKVLPSVASINAAWLRLSSREVDPITLGAEWRHRIDLGLDRGVAFDERRSDDPWCAHVLYADLMRDPIATVRRIYDAFDAEVQPLHARRMKVWLRDRGQDAFGRHVYDPADFGYVPDQIAERHANYRARFDVPLEP